MKMVNYNTNCTTHRGAVLVEIVIAIVVCSLITSIVIPTLDLQQKSLERLVVYGRMLYVARAALEKTMAYDMPQYSTDIEREITTQSIVESVEPCMKEALVTASSTYPNFVRPLIIAALYTDQLASIALGNDCGGFMNPHSVALPLSVTSPVPIYLGTSTPNAFITNFDFFEGKAYLGASSTDGFNFLIADPKNTTHPIIGRVTVPPVTSVDVADGYAYLAVTGSTSQLQVIDVHDVTHPSIVATRSLPGVSGSYPSGLSVRYYAGRVYVGTHRTAGSEFHIFDVTIPTNPRWLGSVWLNHNIYDIAVSRGYAYLAASGNTSNIIVVDVHDPVHPIKVASVTFTGAEYTNRVFLLGSILYAGRRKGSTPSHPELVALNVANPRAPTIIASSSLAAQVNDIRAIAHHLLVATNAGIFSLTTDAATTTQNFFSRPQLVTSIPTVGLDYENNIIYNVTNGNSPALFLCTSPQ